MKTIIEQLALEELQQIAEDCTSMREFVKRIGYKSTACYNTVRKYCTKVGVSLEHFTGVAKGSIKRTPENTFIKDSTASQAVLRRLYTKGNYTEYKCSICGQEPFWNGKELTLTLDHINGINNDDRLENLRWVCPNCDRQLDTFCARNANRVTFYNHKEKIQNYCIDCGKPIAADSTRCQECYGKSIRLVERPSKNELEQILTNNNGNFTYVGKMYNVTDNTTNR